MLVPAPRSCASTGCTKSQLSTASLRSLFDAFLELSPLTQAGSQPCELVSDRLLWPLPSCSSPTDGSSTAAVSPVLAAGGDCSKTLPGCGEASLASPQPHTPSAPSQAGASPSTAHSTRGSGRSRSRSRSRAAARCSRGDAAGTEGLAASSCLARCAQRGGTHRLQDLLHGCTTDTHQLCCGASPDSAKCSEARKCPTARNNTINRNASTSD